MVDYILGLFKLKFTPNLYYQNIHVETNFRVIYRLQSCHDKRNIVATEIYSVDRKVCRDSNCLNVCSKSNTMSRHREIIVATQRNNCRDTVFSINWKLEQLNVATLKRMSRHFLQSFNLRLCPNILTLCHDIKLLFQI